MHLSEAPSLCAMFTDNLRVSGAAISVFDGEGRQVTVCASNALASRLDELQFELGIGPSWDSLRSAAPVFIDDFDAATSGVSPILGAALLGLPVRSIFAFPMVLGAVVVGVVSLYREQPLALTELEAEGAKFLVGRATAPAVRLALRSAAEEVELSHVQFPPLMRREVHQATGMLIVQLDVSATEAFVRLRSHAFATGRSIQDIAHDIVARTLDLSEFD